MQFISTRGGEKVTGAQAIVQGLAKNGGLFVPETFPKITHEEILAMEDMSYPERAAFVLGKYLGEELGTDFLLESCEKAYANFEGRDPVPLVKVDGEMGLYVLELFHGPTCAFKDMALTLLPYLLNDLTPFPFSFSAQMRTQRKQNTLKSRLGEVSSSLSL